MEVAARDKPRPYGRPEEPGPRQRVSVVEGRAGTSPAPTEDQKSLGQDRGFLLWRGGRGRAPPLRKTRRAWAKTEGFCCGGAGGDKPRPYGRQKRVVGWRGGRGRAPRGLFPPVRPRWKGTPAVVRRDVSEGARSSFKRGPPGSLTSRTVLTRLPPSRVSILRGSCSRRPRACDVSPEPLVERSMTWTRKW